MTERFDEGVKEIAMALFSLGALKYEADYILKQLEKRPEPIEQQVQAVKIVDDKVQDSKFDQVAQEVITRLKQDKSSSQKAASPKAPLDRTSYIYKRLTDGGLTPTAAIGVIANLKVESNLDPGAKQKTNKRDVFGPGRGLAQWERGGRFDTDRINLVKFAKQQGKDWHDLDVQIDFILHELHVHPEYKRVKYALNKATNVEDSTLLFLTKYEKAGIPHAGKRLSIAQELSDKFS